MHTLLFYIIIISGKTSNSSWGSRAQLWSLGSSCSSPWESYLGLEVSTESQLLVLAAGPSFPEALPSSFHLHLISTTWSCWQLSLELWDQAVAWHRPCSHHEKGSRGACLSLFTLHAVLLGQRNQDVLSASHSYPGSCPLDSPPLHVPMATG